MTDRSVKSRRQLSPREQETLDLLIEGLTNQQIAVRLGVSEKMVEKNLTHMYQKIGTRCRTGAVVWALEQRDRR